MTVRNFKEWIIEEKRDIFGFEKEHDFKPFNKRDENPIKPFDGDAMMTELERHEIGLWSACRKFVNEVHWGSGNGSIRVYLGTGLNVVVERQGIDLEGTPRWFAKKVFQIDRDGYGGYETMVATELVDEIKKVYNTELDSPIREWEGVERLVSGMASKLKRTAKDIFIFEGIKKIDPNTFIIQFGVRGHGIEAQDQQRVEQNQTMVYYSPISGVIRLTNYNIESPIGGHSWEYMPSDSDWYFAPTQGQDEIIETIANTMHWY